MSRQRRFSSLKRTSALMAAALTIWSTHAAAQPAVTLPSMKFLTAPLIDPTTAESSYGTATTHSSSFTGVTGFAGQPPEIVEEARALKNDPDLIYEFVHNQISTEFAFGERKGPLGALIDRSGTPFDQNVLFVNLVRQAGYTAQYLIGRVTMSAAQFQAWANVNTAQAACELLSSGGIPAAFNGATASASDCSGLTTFSTVTFLHVWSEVQINGTWYLYDPSVKSLSGVVPVSLKSLSGYTAGQAATYANQSSTSATQGSVTGVKNLNASALNSYLAQTASALTANLKSQYPTYDTMGALGLLKIIPTYRPAGGFRNTSISGYTADLTISGDMPDQYRTTLQVSFFDNGVTALNRLLYADEIYGRRLLIDTNFDSMSPPNYTPLVFSLKVDDVALQSYTCNSGGANCLPGSPNAPTTDAGQVTLTVNHPYLANGGAYADQTVVKQVQTYLPIVLVAGFGNVSPALATKWAGEQLNDKALPGLQGPPAQCATTPSDLCVEPYPGSEGDRTREGLEASWLSEITLMMNEQAVIAGAVGDHQHSLGVIDSRYHLQGFLEAAQSPGSPPPPTFVGIADQFTDLNIDTALSLTSKTANLTSIPPLARAIALASATLEGSVVEQTQDLPDAASTAARFAWGNQPDNEDPCFSTNTPRPFFDFSGTTASQRSPIYMYEGSASGCGIDPQILNETPAQAIAQEESAIAAYLGASFKVSASAESFLGPGARFGPPIPTGPGSGQFYNFFSRQRGAALIATRFDASGNVLEVAHTLTSADGLSKGGGGSEPTRFGQFDPKKAADALKDRFVDRSTLMGVDLKTGTAGYTTPTLLSLGTGSEPYQLDSKLTFKAAVDTCGIFGPCVAPRSGGWNHNWDIRFSLSGSGAEAMGSTSPFAGATSFLAFIALQDIFSETSLTNLQKDVDAALTADWWRQQMVANTATVSRGFSGQQYVRLADGSWLAPIGSPGTLTQTGSRVKTRDNCQGYGAAHTDPASTSRRWDISGVTFSLKNAGGDAMAFAPWLFQYDPDIRCDKAYGFEPTSWTYPQGVSLAFTYDPVQGVTGVTSSLGRTLNFARVNDGFLAHQNVTAFASPTSTVLTAGQTGAAGVSNITDAAGDTWKFDVTSPVARSATQRPIPYPELVHVYEPVSATLPALEYDYDTRGLVEQVKDATALQVGGRGPYVWYIAEGGRGERDDPLNGPYTVYWDTDGDAVRYIDELSRQVTSTYDGRHRVVNRTFPEGDQEQFTYDSFDNVTQLLKISKPTCSTNCTLTVSATYDPNWNKLATITDALGKTTTLAYSPSAGTLSTVTQPVVNSQTPVYTFSYNAIGLPTKEVDPTGITTTHAYDASGNLTSTVEGAAAYGSNPAVNLTTTYTPDAIGNVVTILDPKGNATTTQFDAMRRKTGEQHRNGGASAPAIAAEQYTYDANGRKLTDQRASALTGAGAPLAWAVTTTTYTPTGKVASVTDPASDVTSTTYDALDRVYQVTDPVGRITQTNYDAASEKIAELRGVGTAQQQTYAAYTYTPDGNQGTIVDANGNKTTLVYDGFNRLYQQQFPSTTSGSGTSDTTNYEQYLYDANGNRTSFRRRSGITLTYGYDALNRETSKSVPAVGSAAAYTVSTSYDLDGRITSATVTNGHNVTYAFDAAGRKLTETTSARKLTSGYDAASNRTKLTWPDNSYATFAFDALNRMTGVSPAGNLALTMSYDVLSRRTGITGTTGANTSYGYDTADRLTSLSHDLSGTANDVTFGFGYTKASQVASRTTSNSAYAWSNPLSSTVTSTFDGLNRKTGYTYDASGNETSDGTRTFAYDGENHLVSVTSGSSTFSLAYDALGRLAQTTASGTATNYLYDGDALAGEYSSAGTLLRQYMDGPDTDEPLLWSEGSGFTDLRHLHADRQGSIIAYSNASAASQATYTYGPYGEPSAWGGSRYRYTGQIELPEVSLYYYKARVYDPVAGRFLQTDPVGYDADLNLYAYTVGDPVNRNDPSGNRPPPWSTGGGSLGSACNASLGGCDAAATLEDAQAVSNSSNSQSFSPAFMSPAAARAISTVADVAEKGGIVAGAVAAAPVVAAGALLNLAFPSATAADDTPREILYHYTTGSGAAGIVTDQAINPSLRALNPTDARYGDGQYFTDIRPGSMTNSQLSRALVGIPFQGNRFSNYVAIDVRGLPATQVRQHVFVVPNKRPLSVVGRIIGVGSN